MPSPSSLQVPPLSQLESPETADIQTTEITRAAMLSTGTSTSTSHNLMVWGISALQIGPPQDTRKADRHEKAMA